MWLGRDSVGLVIDLLSGYNTFRRNLILIRGDGNFVSCPLLVWCSLLSQVQGRACETHDIPSWCYRQGGWVQGFAVLLLKCSSSLSCCLLNMYRGSISLCGDYWFQSPRNSRQNNNEKYMDQLKTVRTVYLEPDTWMSEEGSVTWWCWKWGHYIVHRINTFFT